MAETGVLPPGARVELLDGRIIDMSSIGRFHGGLVKRLSRLFNLEANAKPICSQASKPGPKLFKIWWWI